MAEIDLTDDHEDDDDVWGMKSDVFSDATIEQLGWKVPVILMEKNLVRRKYQEKGKNECDKLLDSLSKKERRGVLNLQTAWYTSLYTLIDIHLIMETTRILMD